MRYKRWRRENRASYLVSQARQRAKKKGMDFTVTPEFVQLQLDIGICPVTGIVFETHDTDVTSAFAPSLDRIDPNQGYTLENTQVVVRIYNHAKNTYKHSDVRGFARALMQQEGEIECGGKNY